MNGNPLDRFPASKSPENREKEITSLEGKVGELREAIETIESAVAVTAPLSFPAGPMGEKIKADLLSTMHESLQHALTLIQELNTGTLNWHTELAAATPAERERMSKLITDSIYLTARLKNSVPSV